MLLGLLAGLAACPAPRAAGPADQDANPYQNIVARNVFKLNPPPPPQDPTPARAPTPKIFLTGIATLGGSRRALLKTAPVAKPGEPPKEHSYMLTEGERQDDLEVNSIDEHEGIVKVTYAGEQISVNFKDNAAASTTPSAPPPGTPGAPGAPAAPAPAASPFSPPPVFNPGFRAAPPPTANPTASVDGQGAAGLQAGMPRTAAPVISAEEQAVLIELNREANKTADPMAPPFPPSLLTEELNAANQADQAPNTTGNNQGSTKPGVAVPSLPIPGRGGLSFPGLP